VTRRFAARRDLEVVPPASNIDDVTSESSAVAAPRATETALLLDAAGAAAVLGLSRSAFYQLDVSGLVPGPVRLGTIRRWSRDELRRWVEEGCPPRTKWEMSR